MHDITQTDRPPYPSDVDAVAAQFDAETADETATEHAGDFAVDVSAIRRRIQDGCTNVMQAIASNATVDALGELLDEMRETLTSVTPAPQPISIGELAKQYPRMRPPVVHGLLREGETANIAAPSKVGKSWAAYDLALSVATGGSWLGAFRCEQGRVLYLDNELHHETLAYRFNEVANALGFHWPDVAESVDVVALRGQGHDLHALGPILDRIEAGEYRVVIADAWYRFIPAGTSENDNAAVMGLYNRLDEYADKLKAAWVNVHHSTKGSQSDKRVTDVGSGASAQSRAADAHIIMREHQDDGVFVLDAAVRSWKPVAPLALRWDYPLWQVDENADPARLKRLLSPAQQTANANDERDVAKIVASLAGRKQLSPSALRKLVGCGAGRMNRLLAMLDNDNRIVRDEATINGKSAELISLFPVEGNGTP